MSNHQVLDATKAEQLRLLKTLELFPQTAIGTSDGEDAAATRFWENGRIGAHDDGTTAYVIATDTANRVIRIAFPKPVDWIGFDVTAAEALRDQLTKRIDELAAIRSPPQGESK